MQGGGQNRFQVWGEGGGEGGQALVSMHREPDIYFNEDQMSLSLPPTPEKETLHSLFFLWMDF